MIQGRKTTSTFDGTPSSNNRAFFSQRHLASIVQSELSVRRPDRAQLVPRLCMGERAGGCEETRNSNTHEI